MLTVRIGQGGDDWPITGGNMLLGGLEGKHVVEGLEKVYRRRFV